MFKKMKEKDGVTIVTQIRNEIASKIYLIMEIMSGIKKIRTGRLRQRDGNGQDSGRSVRRMVRRGASRSGCVRRSPKGCGRTETSERGRTTREMKGNVGEWLGRHGKS